MCVRDLEIIRQVIHETKVAFVMILSKNNYNRALWNTVDREMEIFLNCCPTRRGHTGG